MKTKLRELIEGLELLEELCEDFDVNIDEEIEFMEAHENVIFIPIFNEQAPLAEKLKDLNWHWSSEAGSWAKNLF